MKAALKKNADELLKHEDEIFKTAKNADDAGELDELFSPAESREGKPSAGVDSAQWEGIYPVLSNLELRDLDLRTPNTPKHGR